MTSKPTLRALISWRIGTVFTASVLVFTFVVGVIVYGQVHEQTDAMLRQLAHTEADGVLSEYDNGVHVHDTSLRLPALNSPVVDKYAAAYRPDGHVLASTLNFAVKQLPSGWWDGSTAIGSSWVFDDEETGPMPLRVAVLVAETPHGERLLFASAIPQAQISRAIHGAVLLIGMLAALMLVAMLIASNLVARQITQDIHALSGQCIDLREAPGQLELWLRTFDTSGHTTAETTTLAQTVHSLVTRLQRLLEVQNRFVAEAAHELRTPLTALQGELELALRRERDAESYKSFIANARIDAARLADLAEHLLEAARSREEGIVFEPLALKDLLQETVARHSSLLLKAGLETTLETDDSKAMADPIAAGRVLDNLIINAAKHSQGAHLWLRCADGVITIRDDGRGVSEAVRQNLFVPFAQRKSGGHGLGLFIAARLMEKLRGSLVLEDTTGGATWTCTFYGADGLSDPPEA